MNSDPFEMKKITLLLSGLLLSFVAYSTGKAADTLNNSVYQNSEFAFTRYEPDTLAEALFLSDVGKSFFVYDSDYGTLMLHFIRKFRIKILSKAGFDWCNVEIPLRKDGDTMDELLIAEGVTYTMENGKVRKTKLDPKSVYKEDRSNHTRLMKFAMPDVQVGSVIEVQYEVRSPFVFFYNDWEFQKSIPVIYSEYTACMIPFYTYTYLLQGKNKFDEESMGASLSDRSIAGIKFHDMVYTFIMKDLTAFRSEPFITCPEDYIIKLNFQLCESITPEGSRKNYLSTWPNFCGTMLSRDIFGGKINAAASKSKELLKSMVLPDSLEKRTKAVYDWVVSSFNWNGQYDKYTDMKTSAFLKSRSGTTADINLFLIGMLRAAGAEVFPVLISTRDHGKFKVDTPFDFFFNYVVAAAWINGKYVLLDATEPTIGYGNLPVRCINEKGFLIRNKKVFDWVILNDGKTSMERYSLLLEPVVGSDSTDCQVGLSADGHFAMDYRETCQTQKSELKKAVLSTDLSLVGSLTLKNESDPSKPFEALYKARMLQNEENGMLWVKPFLGIMNVGNPLKKPTRVYPIDLIYRQGRNFDVTIRIPEGYALSSIPTVPVVDDMNFRLSYNYDLKDKNTLLIKASYEFKKEIYDAAEYDKLKNFFRTLDEVFNQSVVLKAL